MLFREAVALPPFALVGLALLGPRFPCFFPSVGHLSTHYCNQYEVQVQVVILLPQPHTECIDVYALTRLVSGAMALVVYIFSWCVYLRLCMLNRT